MSAVETIELDENTRLRVEYDTDAESPLTWGDHVTKGDESYQRWAEGEVFGVIVERRFTVLAQRVDDPASDVAEGFEWRETDSIWGCYLDDQYTAQICAAEHFGTPVSGNPEEVPE